MLRKLVVPALLLVVAFPVLAKDQDGVPKLHVRQPVVDFGEVRQGEVKEATFEVENKGTGVLHIRAARPTCGCTVAEWDREVAPGEVGTVRAKLDTSGYRGPIAKAIILVTDDPENPMTTLTLKANVKPYIDVLPNPLVRMRMKVREEAEAKLKVVSYEKEEFKIVGVTSSNPNVKVTYRRLSKDELLSGFGDCQYELVIKAKAGKEPGRLQSEITIKTDNKHVPELKVKLFAIVQAFVRVNPRRLDLGTAKPSEKPGWPVIVDCKRPDCNLVVEEAKVEGDDRFDTLVKPVQQKKRYQVIVKLKEDAEPGKVDAKLVIKTNDKEYKELEVPMTGRISR